MPAEPNDDAAEFVRETVELTTGHRREERTRECFVIPLELGDEPFASRGKGHQRRSPVAWVQLACHKTVGDQSVHESGHCSRRHLQRFGKDTLGYRAALT